MGDAGSRRRAGTRPACRVGLLGTLAALVVAASACSGSLERLRGTGAASADVVPVASAAPAMPQTPDCVAISGMRIAQFIAQSMSPSAPQADREAAKNGMHEQMQKVIAAVPGLKDAGDRLEASIAAYLDGKPLGPPQGAQPTTAQDADRQIAEYQHDHCDPSLPSSGGASAALAPAPVPSTSTTTLADGSSGVVVHATGQLVADAPEVWKRTYVVEAPLGEGEAGVVLVGSCNDDLTRGVRQNDVVGKPRITVLGDSAANIIRPVAVVDDEFHWAFATHCGEKIGTVFDDGRLEDAKATKPDVFVIMLGSNNTNEDWQLRADLIPKALDDWHRLLEATADQKCRVIVDVANVPHPKDTPQDAKLRVELNDKINQEIYKSEGQPGIHIAHWSDRARQDPRKYIIDHAHPTPAGSNLLINTILETAQACLSPSR